MAHFYERNEAGEIVPRHFVPMASRPGESRPTRVTDAKKHGWHPSVTTIQGLLDKPALTDWKITEHLKVAYEWTNIWGKPKELSPSYADCSHWMDEIKQCTREALDKAPKDGTDFHDELEQWFSPGMAYTGGHKNICQAVECLLEDNCDVIATYENPVWISEQSFVHSLGYGGKVDIHCPGWVVDFKTKNSADKWKPKKMAYPEMAMQLAAYRVGLGLDNARCANVFICLEDGAVEFHEWSAAELDKQFANFTDLLRIWLRNAEYVPGSTTPTSL